MSMTPEEQRALAIECDLEFKGWDELAAYTAAVEAKERENICINGNITIELLKRIEKSLGSFCSDEGWSQADMDVMDSVSAILAIRSI